MIIDKEEIVKLLLSITCSECNIHPAYITRFVEKDPVNLVMVSGIRLWCTSEKCKCDKEKPVFELCLATNSINGEEMVHKQSDDLVKTTFQAKMD